MKDVTVIDSSAAEFILLPVIAIQIYIQGVCVA